MKEKIKKVLKYILLGFAWSLVVLVWVVFIAFWLIWLVFPYMILAYMFIPPIIMLFVSFMHKRFMSVSNGNVILFGGKGKGKSLTQQFIIYKEYKKTGVKPLGNIDFGYNEVVAPHTYFESITPNNSRNMINNTLTLVKKIEEWEGRNYHFDDTNAFAPNTEDAYLKQYYKSMNLFILIQRHLYNSRSVMNAQSLERMYKNLRELQLDGYVKALGYIGFNWFWNKLPILRKYVYIKVRYYSQYDSALVGRLPFEKLAMLNRGVEMGGLGYTTTSSALKRVYEAENGVIKDYGLWLNVKHIKYDTREYHKWIFGNAFTPPSNFI